VPPAGTGIDGQPGDPCPEAGVPLEISPRDPEAIRGGVDRLHQVADVDAGCKLVDIGLVHPFEIEKPPFEFLLVGMAFVKSRRSGSRFVPGSGRMPSMWDPVSALRFWPIVLPLASRLWLRT
jgi:hypothetical protein